MTRISNSLIISFLTLVSLLSFSQATKAQVVIDFTQIMKTQNVKLRLFLQEQKTETPIAYASVYLKAPGDSTIAYFALSDEKGETVINDIIPGEYNITAEMIGYLPYTQTKKLKGREVNLGVVTMKEDKKLLEAAKVSAIGNAIMVKGDTLVYNASAFNVGENAMLEDLLKKMPGMEVSKDGTVTVGGEKVDRITVGGKTFFFNDPTMALKNLPAKIVEKISIIDKDNESAKFTGISTAGDKEKVMDVGLKEEYKNGWFGNASVNGGSTLMTKNENTPKDIIEPVYNANLLVAGYNDKDQLTIIGNGRNVRGAGVMISFGGEDSEDFDNRTGQTTSAQAGANYNTDRLKSFETNVNANYNFTNKDAREKSTRLSFMQEGEDLLSESHYKGIGFDHKVNVNAELVKKDTRKFMFSIKPTFTFTKSKRDILNVSQTTEGEIFKNSNESSTFSDTKKYSSNIEMRAGIRKLGKDRRSLNLNVQAWYTGSDGISMERLTTKFANTAEYRNLSYDSRKSFLTTYGQLSYVEPINNNWSIMATVSGKYGTKDIDRQAKDTETGLANSYYSSLSYNTNIGITEQLLAQFNKDRTNLTFGLQLIETKNINYSRALDVEKTSGEDEWITNWSPFAHLRFSKNNTSLNVSTSGNSNTHSGIDIIPVIDITNPMQISTGNIYLKPDFRYHFSMNIRNNNPKSQFYIGGYAMIFMNLNEKVYASWFDKNGIRYAIPVNSQKPSSSTNVSIFSTIPLNKKKNLTLNVDATFIYSTNHSYQAKGSLDGLDIDNFNYSDFISQIWGDANGSRFYSGESGFAESKTDNFRYNAYMTLKYRMDNFNISAEVGADNRINLYSFDPQANMNTWKFNAGGELQWNLDKGWEFATDISYNFYRGYTNGYGKPELIWNASISKSVKAFTFSLSANDILNQRRMLSRSVTSGYMEDTYTNVIGRYVMLGVTFNFGKMNAQNNMKAQQAMYKMMY